MKRLSYRQMLFVCFYFHRNCYIILIQNEQSDYLLLLVLDMEVVPYSTIQSC